LTEYYKAPEAPPQPWELCGKDPWGFARAMPLVVVMLNK